MHHHCYAHLTRLVVGGDSQGGVDPSSMPFEKGIYLIWEIITVLFAHLCIDLMKEITPVEGN